MAYLLALACGRVGCRPREARWRTLARLQEEMGDRVRKDLPLKDVAAAGGWKDVTTVPTCYQHADD